MMYRGYRLADDDIGSDEVEIYDKDGALIDGAPTVGEAMMVIDDWMDAP